ncbi:hypothetical protein [Paeniglutamicibacter sp. NPDC091659]|uniref:hypothetical protein n=1 Tax=Paeniglutamicibacter sp. NPDC091659 TaxID=3364389 RepID=UPI00380FAE74
MAFVSPLMPDSTGHTWRPFGDNRLMTEGVIYRFRSWKTVPKRHRRFGNDGIWDTFLGDAP